MSQSGATWYERGTLSTGHGRAKVHLYNYYRCDKLSDEQRERIRAIFPLVEFFGASKQYAPELRSVMVAFPKAARMRQLATPQQ